VAVSRALLQAAQKLIGERGGRKVVTYTQSFECFDKSFCGDKAHVIDETNQVLVTFEFIVKG